MKLLKLQRGLDGQLISLDPLAALGLGGEATVYPVPQDPALAAKVYHRPTEAHGRKLSAMRARSPLDPTPSDGHCAIAWPVDLLHTVDRKRRIVGFLMPRMTGMSPIIDVYSPHARLRQRPWFNYQHLLRTAASLAGMISAIHDSGYVIGDLNHTNIFVSDDAQVTLIDTDSFQVRDPETGAVYPCGVYTPEFTPPELQAIDTSDASLVERSIQHDCFGLAVLVFLLLMGGVHPFAGIPARGGDPPPLAERIAAGHFPYGSRPQGDGAPYHPPVIAYPFDILAPHLRQLFIQCFEDGHDNPHARPTAHTWEAALSQAESALVICPANQQHRYGDHLSACPWCQRAAQLGGRDPFPSAGDIESAGHLRPIGVTRTLAEGHVAPWHAEPQRTETVPPGLRFQPDSPVWVTLALALWIGAPGLWGVMALAAPNGLPVLGVLLVGLYAMAAVLTPAALATVGWRRSLSLAGSARWIGISALGVVAGAALIGLITLLTVF